MSCRAHSQRRRKHSHANIGAHVHDQIAFLQQRLHHGHRTRFQPATALMQSCQQRNVLGRGQEEAFGGPDENVVAERNGNPLQEEVRAVQEGIRRCLPLQPSCVNAELQSIEAGFDAFQPGLNALELFPHPALSSHGIQPNRVYAELQSIYAVLQSIYAVLQSINAGLVAFQPVMQPVEIVEGRNCESSPDRCLDPQL
jgi:hypothetical protein